MTRSLPERPDLDHLRHEAKTLLRAARSGALDATQRLAAVPRLVALSLEQRLDTARLADAQHALAREYGFESWPRLKLEVEARQPLALHATRFLKALRDGDDGRAARIAAQHPGIARIDACVAAALGDEPAFIAAVAADSGCATRDSGAPGWTPLFYCCVGTALAPDDALQPGRVHIVEHALANGADANAIVHWATGDDASPVLSSLYFAVQSGALGMVRVLLAHGAKPNDGESVFHGAQHDRRDCLDALLAHGADLDATHAPYHNTPLYFLMGFAEGHVGTERSDRGVEWLLAHGANPDAPSGAARETALHAAARHGRGPAMIDRLLASGARVDAARADGVTPLGLALREGCAGTAALLRARGASEALVSEPDRFLAACAAGDAAAVRALTERDPGWVAALGDDARAALARAAHHGRIEALRLMLEAGFPVTSSEGMDATALHWAAWTGQAEAVRLLLAAGAPVDVRDRTYGSSPLAWACHGARFTRQAQSPYLQIVDALIAAGSTREPAINRWGEGPEVFASAELAANLVAAGLVSAELWAAVELDREPEAG